MSFDIDKIVDNFEKIDENKVIEIKKSDINPVSVASPVSPTAATCIAEIDRFSDRIIAMINAANKVKRFNVDYRMLRRLLHRVGNVYCCEIDFVRKDGYKDCSWRAIKICRGRDFFYIDGVNVFKELYEMNISLSSPTAAISSYFTYPSDDMLTSFVDDFDTIERFFYDYLECLSKGDIFKETKHTIYRIPAGSSTKEIYYDERKSSPVLKASII